MWFNSTGRANYEQSHSMGEYKRRGTWEDRSYWKKSRGNKVRYLYWTCGKWFVSDDLGWCGGNLKRESDGKEPPGRGWEYYEDRWRSDSRLTLRTSSGFCGSDKGRDAKAKELGYSRHQIDNVCKDPQAICFAKVLFLNFIILIIINIYRDQR